MRFSFRACLQHAPYQALSYRSIYVHSSISLKVAGLATRDQQRAQSCSLQLSKKLPLSTRMQALNRLLGTASKEDETGVAKGSSAWRRTPLTRLLDIELPIVGAPLANVNTPEYTAAVSRAGGLGIYGVGPMMGPPDEAFHQLLARLKDLSHDKPFGLNLFVPPPVIPLRLSMTTEAALEAWADAYASVAEAAGLDTKPALAPLPSQDALQKQWEHFEAGAAVAIGAGVKVLSFHFGVPSALVMDAVRTAGVVTFATATTLREAQAVVDAGVDVVVLQGLEAGGHRGSFYPGAQGAAGKKEEPLSTAALLALAVPRIDKPLVVAGGVMNGAGIVAAIAAGASGAQMGTAFLGAPECKLAEFQRAALLTAADLDTPLATVATAAFTGKTARGLPTKLTAEAAGVQGALSPYFGLLNARAILGEAASKSAADVAMTLCGQGYPLCRGMSTKEVVEQLAEEGDAACARLCSH